MQYNISVDWTGSYPNLCSGQWIIKINDKQLGGITDDHMSTKGTYSSWHFENWDDVWSQYEDGLSFDEWKVNMPNNLEMSLRLAGFSPKDEQLLKPLFEAISTKDWRHNSCGGCI